MASKGAVRFVGLDALSLDLASSLLRSGYKVQAFEMDGNLISEFLKLGGTRCGGPEEVGKDVAALVVLADQVNDATFSDEGASKGFQKDTVVILRSTILPSSIQNLKTRFTDTADLVDIYATKGVSDGFNGKIMIASSGGSDAILKARPVLSAMCDNLYVFEGEVGAGSKIRMIKELLEGIHLVASLEAISLGTKAGIHPWIIYDIISNAAGNSWVFKNHIPQLLRGAAKDDLNTLVQNLRVILDLAKSLSFPLPLLAIAHQQLILGSPRDNTDDEDATLIKVWEQKLGVRILDAANAETYIPEELASHTVAKSYNVHRVGFIGLGAMGFGMATYLLKANFSVCGYDVSPQFVSRLKQETGI